MTDEIKNETSAEGQPDERIVMQLILTKDGQLKVGGPGCTDKIMALGLLELAKTTLQTFWAKSEIKLHKPGAMLNFARNGR